MTIPDDDRTLDDRVRAAADRPFDETATSDAVLRRIEARRRPLRPARRSAWGGILIPAGFVSALVATPLVVAVLPGPLDATDAFVFQLATGAPFALVPDGALGPDGLPPWFAP